MLLYLQRVPGWNLFFPGCSFSQLACACACVCVRICAEALLEFGAGVDLVLLLYESECSSVIEVMGD